MTAPALWQLHRFHPPPRIPAGKSSSPIGKGESVYHAVAVAVSLAAIAGAWGLFKDALKGTPR